MSLILTSSPTDRHGSLAPNPMWYLWSKYDCFLISVCQDIDLQKIYHDNYHIINFLDDEPQPYPWWCVGFGVMELVNLARYL